MSLLRHNTGVKTRVLRISYYDIIYCQVMRLCLGKLGSREYNFPGFFFFFLNFRYLKSFGVQLLKAKPYRYTTNYTTITHTDKKRPFLAFRHSLHTKHSHPEADIFTDTCFKS